MTLIEVLVALAVLAAVAGSLLVLLGQQSRQASRLEQRMLARIVAENALTEYIASNQTGRRLDLRGEADLSGQTFSFRIDRDPAPLEGYETVAVNVRVGRDGQVLATLTTLRPAVAP